VNKNILLMFALICLVTTGGCVDDDPCGGYSAPGVLFCHGDNTEGKIALTFDDGPNEPYTSQILDLLDLYKIKATFFVLGKRVEKYPQVTRRILAAGHVIGNHSYSHQHLSMQKQEVVEQEIDRGDRAIFAATGIHPTLFRSPYGELSIGVIDAVEHKAMSLISWSMTPKDWHKIDAKTISDRVMSQVANGSIILMHDGDGIHDGDRQRVVVALTLVIPLLKAAGYQFVTVPELLGLPADALPTDSAK
jgi:peptidoglycan-N-acetylglucosamine deacetylase